MFYPFRSDIFQKCQKCTYLKLNATFLLLPRSDSGRNQARERERVKCLFPSDFSEMGNLGERQWALCKTKKVKGMINNLAFHGLHGLQKIAKCLTDE